MSLPILGIDIAKRKFDVALLREQRYKNKKFDNTPDGFQSLRQWLEKLGVNLVHACLEATGSYGDALALVLHERGHQVSMVNPLRISGFAKAQLQRNKTDRADAKLIADFCASQQPALWSPPAPEFSTLPALTRRLQSLEEMRHMELNRLDSTAASTRASIQRIVAQLDTEIALLLQHIHDHFDQHPHLSDQQSLLQTIPGIGEKTAQALLSEIEFARYDSAPQVAAAAGVTPRQQQSGTSLHRSQLSKLGNSRIRKALYFPAVVALQHNPLIKAFGDRLRARGKRPLQIVCAAMRKLLHLAYGVLKHQLPFNGKLVFDA